MNTKQKAAIGVIILLVVLVVVLLIFNNTGSTKTVFFEGTDYPVTVVQKKSGMEVIVKAKANQDVPWTVYVTDADIAGLTLKGDKKPDSEKYVINPLKDGTTYIHLEKVQEAYGYAAVLISIDIPINVTAEGNNLITSLMEGEVFYLGAGDFVANNSEFPFILKSNGAAADIAFINGMGDWTIDTMDAPVRYEISEPEEGEAVVRLYYYEAYADLQKETAEGGETEETETKPVEELTEEEATQQNMESIFGAPPEGYSYDNLIIALTPEDFNDPHFRIRDEEGNDITEQVREQVFGGGTTEENAATEENNAESTEETASEETTEVAETEETASEETAETVAETETNEETTSEETDIDWDIELKPEDVILTKINFHSDSLNETVYIDIVIDTLGNLYLSKGEAPN